MLTRAPAVLAVILAFPAPAWAQAIDGREFPKTLTFDEPGIDDEVSLPTLIEAPQGAAPGRETDLNFELDKRLTPRVSLQINSGYTSLPRARATGTGWQNVQATLKYVVLPDTGAERLASISLTREFGGSGAARITEAAASSTILAVNFGQGFTPITQNPLFKPLAVTGSAGYSLPDRANTSATQQAVLALSVQYSLDVLAANTGAPAYLRPFIPVVECVYAQPVDGRAARLATLAPGLIYAGEGFQLAAEALVPLTAASGRHIGAIAQLNISLGAFGVPWLAHPLWP